MLLHTRTYGPQAGPPVLVLHGVRDHGGRLRRLAEDALPDDRVIAPDLRGHGRSGWEPPWDVATHVADVLETLAGHDVGEPIEVIGHSFGRLIARAVAAQAPERVCGRRGRGPA
jgi:lipase